MSAHTPGPWRIADDVYPSFLKVDGPSFKLSVVMWATDLDESDYQSRLADLRLIAAAPELLEALETIASGTLPRCPFEDPHCAITEDQLCPVCGDSSDINAESKCPSVTGSYQGIARVAIAKAREIE